MLRMLNLLLCTADTPCDVLYSIPVMSSMTSPVWKSSRQDWTKSTPLCRRIFKETGKLLVAFSIGSVATVVGTLVAFKLIPLQALGPMDSWKIASALAARHIGGAINYVAISEALQVSPSAQMAGLAADNLL